VSRLDLDAPADRLATRELFVRRATWEAAGVLSIELIDPDGADLPPWSPGAHLDLILSSGLVRQYSLCGSRLDRKMYRVAVLREDSGRGASIEIHESLRVGGTLKVRGPRNLFPLEDHPRYVFVADSIGVTPIVAMIEHVEASGRPWHLVFGGRTSRSMPFVGELLTRTGGRLELVPQDQYGIIDIPALLDQAPQDAGIYACGRCRWLISRLPRPSCSLGVFKDLGSKTTAGCGFRSKIFPSGGWPG
jgi:ferredoxin-NADP reductase